MKNKILKFNNFIYEKLGIAPELEELTNTIMDKLSKAKENKSGGRHCVITSKLRDENFILDVLVHKSIDTLGKFGEVDSKNKRFKILLKSMDKHVLIHELKHLDRYLAKNHKEGNKHNKYSKMTNINNYATKKLSHLFKTKTHSQILGKVIYYSNPDEFEAYFNGFYSEIKSDIDKLPNPSKEDKVQLIKDRLQKSEIYPAYTILNKYPFEIENFFNNNRDMNQYFKHIKNLDVDFHKADTEWIGIKKSDILWTMITSFISPFQKDEEKDKLHKEINKLVNDSIRKNVNKFSRLYTLLT